MCWAYTTQGSNLAMATAVVALPFVRRALKFYKYIYIIFLFVAVVPSWRITITRSRKQCSLNYLHVHCISSNFHHFSLNVHVPVVSMQGRSPIDSPSGLSGHVQIVHHQYHITTGQNACSRLAEVHDRNILHNNNASCRGKEKNKRPKKIGL